MNLTIRAVQSLHACLFISLAFCHSPVSIGRSTLFLNDRFCLISVSALGSFRLSDPTWRPPRLHVKSSQRESERFFKPGQFFRLRWITGLEASTASRKLIGWWMWFSSISMTTVADLQQYEVEDFIAELMDQEFNTVVDDGSLPQVSANLLQMFGQWRQGALEQLKHTINTLTQNKSQRAKVTAQPTQSDEESNDDAQEMECEASGPSVSRTHPPPTQDEEDGWTVVRKKK
uniref:Pre-rRNA-processing protein TSR2 homolog n=1 Tax=Astatotilapia calliptera TaxID=8154 RepID=A0AAX7USX6_ASTCA